MHLVRRYALGFVAVAAAVLCGSALADYKVEFTVSGYAGSTPLTNFPVLVRLAADSPQAFDYSDCAADGSDIRFEDSNGDQIGCEIQSWDTNGESLVWVNIPVVTNGATFYMLYGSGVAVPAVADTWSRYVGVWHMDEASGSVADATGHGLTASPQGNTANSVAVAGAVGNGRQTATSAAKGYLSVPNYDSFGLGHTFTMSGWVKMTACTQYPRVFSRKANYTDANGWEVEMNNGSMANFAARGINNSPGYSGTFSPSLQNAWSHLAFVYSGATLTVYQNGAQIKTGDITAATDNGLALSFGCDSDGSETYLQGAFDECRLLGGAASADWVKAEYDTASSASFLTAGHVTSTVNPVVSVKANGIGDDGFTLNATVLSLGGGASSCDLWFTCGTDASALPPYTLVSAGLAAGATMSRNVTGLEEGVEYTYSVIASNDLGNACVKSGVFTPRGIDFKRPDPAVAEFSRGVKFTVAGYAGTEELTNFPVLVRISDNSPAGFSYADFYSATGDDLCFLDANGNGIPHEIDTWNTSGESLVWVTLPTMTNGTEFAMWYRSSKSGSDVCADNAWEDYTGVWHLGEGGDGAQYVYDSTTNALTGVTHANSLAVSAGCIGAARRNSTKSGNSAANGRILVSLGDADSPQRAVVDAIVPEFSASLWFSPKGNADWSYLIARKGDDALEGWGIQFGHNTDFQPVRIWASLGKNDGAYYRTFSPGAPYGNLAGMNQVTWRKVNIVYGSDGYVDFYYDGGAYHTRQQVPLCGKNFDNNLSEILARNGDADLAIGGMSASGYGSFNGEMDEVRLRKGKDSADWVKAEYDAVVNTTFVTGGEVVHFAETPRPVATLALSDSSAGYAQFSGSIGTCGGDATACGVLVKVWKTAESEPSSWTTLAPALAEGEAFSEAVTGLDPEMPYSWKIKAVNNLESPQDSDVVEGSFTTGGTGVGGVGGERVRIGNDYIHTFAINAADGIKSFTFMPPSYITGVRALVVAGGGPGGYRRGGGGGAGGLIYSDDFAMTGGETYTVNVGTGGVASASDDAYGTAGEDSTIFLGAAEVARAIGGGAGGNGNNTSFRAGVDGGSGGGSAYTGVAGGVGTAGQGNDGGLGNSYNNSVHVAGGGGGAGRVGGSGSSDSPPSGGSGGQGFATDISGTFTYYAGGGGGGGMQSGSASNLGSPGGGGDGGGGRGGMAVPSGTVNPSFSEIAVPGADGLGGGGGGGSDVSGYYAGANGGNGIVILRYTVLGSGAGTDEPFVSFTGAEYAGDLRINGSYRVAWAGEGEDRADVHVLWGYSPNSLTHDVEVASDTIGEGTFSFPIYLDQVTIYMRVMAVNDGGYEFVSDEIRSITIPQYDGVVPGDPTIPTLGAVSLSEFDGIYARVAGVVTSFGTAAAGENEIDGCEVRAYVGTTPDITRMTALGAMPVATNETFSYVITNIAPALTYYWYLEARNSAGVTVATAVDSFTTLGGSAIGPVSSSVNQQTFTLSGSLTSVGASTTYVLVRWKDAGGEWSDWQTIKTFDQLSSSLSFTETYRRETWGSSSWEVICSNECAYADGTMSGIYWTDPSLARSGTCPATDKATYTWQPVDGDWNGAWTNAAHWSCDKADNLGYPQSNSATASFANCTLSSPVTVTVPGQYSIGPLNLFGANPASLTFVGTGAATSRITTTALQDKAIKANTSIEFRDMTLSRGSEAAWLVMDSSVAGGPTNITLRLSGATLSYVNALTVAAPFSKVEFLDGSTATFSSKMSIGGTNSVVTIEDSRVSAKAIYIPADADGPGMKVLLRGTAPLLKQHTTDGTFGCWAQSWPVVYEFQVPVGGYAAAPVQMVSTAYKFGQAHNDDKSGATPTFSFTVAKDSPAIHDSKHPIANNVLVTTVSGFYTGFMADPLGITPSSGGKSLGAFKYGVGGAPLEEGDDVSTARQILLDFTGRKPMTVFIVQ